MFLLPFFPEVEKGTAGGCSFKEMLKRCFTKKWKNFLTIFANFHVGHEFVACFGCLFKSDEFVACLWVILEAMV